jgi:DNA-binding NarL/FixJ family response regulator
MVARYWIGLIKEDPRSWTTRCRVRPGGAGAESGRALMRRARPVSRIEAVPSVLIVDDHSPFRRAARALLERGGFRVVGEAEDGEAALNAVQRLTPDVVLLDIQLPGEDGFAICERIAATAGQGRAGGPTVVLTSGRPVATFRRRLAASRATGFIAKTDLTAAALSTLLRGAAAP